MVLDFVAEHDQMTMVVRFVPAVIRMFLFRLLPTTPLKVKAFIKVPIPVTTLPEQGCLMAAAVVPITTAAAVAVETSRRADRAATALTTVRLFLRAGLGA
jgi:hypothetical protein